MGERLSYDELRSLSNAERAKVGLCYDLGKIHIPGCMGCAALGHSHCTCDVHIRFAESQMEECNG